MTPIIKSKQPRYCGCCNMTTKQECLQSTPQKWLCLRCGVVAEFHPSQAKPNQN